MYDIQGNLQDGSQVVVSVIFENKCDSFLKSMEFNVLDSLNSKLQRPEGAGAHDGLTVPFQLPPGQLLSAMHAPAMSCLLCNVGAFLKPTSIKLSQVLRLYQTFAFIYFGLYSFFMQWLKNVATGML